MFQILHTYGLFSNGSEGVKIFIDLFICECSFNSSEMLSFNSIMSINVLALSCMYMCVSQMQRLWDALLPDRDTEDAHGSAHGS